MLGLAKYVSYQNISHSSNLQNYFVNSSCQNCIHSYSKLEASFFDTRFSFQKIVFHNNSRILMIYLPILCQIRFIFTVQKYIFVGNRKFSLYSVILFCCPGNELIDSFVLIFIYVVFLCKNLISTLQPKNYSHKVNVKLTTDSQVL